MDYTTITTAVDFAGVTAGVGAIGASLAGVYIAIKGTKMLLGFLGGRS